MQGLRRILRHLCTGRAALVRRFPPPALRRIEDAVKACEAHHQGEIRFVAEAALPLPVLLRGGGARQRALAVFAQLRVWDTEHNNGVLIYLLLADRAVEIVADRGVAGGRVAQAEWDAVCQRMRQQLGDGDFADAGVSGVEAVSDVLARHPPGAHGRRNELPDAPVLLS